METNIIIFSQYKDADLLKMCTHRLTGFLNLFSKSITKGITNHSKLPVITINV